MKFRLNDQILNKVNQFLLAFYLSMFAITKFLSTRLEINSFYLLLVGSLMIVLISLGLNLHNPRIQRPPIVTLLAIGALILISFIAKHNGTLNSYAYNFAIFGAIPLYLMIWITKLDSFYKFFAILGVLNLILLGADPINGYSITGDYMAFGYIVALPSYIGIYLGRKYLKMKWLIIAEVAALLLIIIYANQGAALSALTTVLFTNILVDKISLKKLLVFLLTGVAALVLSTYTKPILQWSIETTSRRGETVSYALTKSYDALYGNADTLSGREELWNKAIGMYNENPVFGYGIGAFQEKYGVYTHNIILEIGVSLGVVGVLIFFAYALYYLSLLLKTSADYRLPKILGITLGILPLMLSMQPFIWPYFWVFSLNPWIHTESIASLGEKS